MKAIEEAQFSTMQTVYAVRVYLQTSTLSISSTLTAQNAVVLFRI